MRCLLCARIRVRDTVINLEFDEKGETYDEELLQAESEHDGTAEQEEKTPVSAKNKFKNKIFRGTLKHLRYQPETPSAVLMQYLVESDKENKQNHLLIPLTHFFRSIAATVKSFFLIIKIFAKSRISAIVSEVEMT
jgi:hypothetical protein